MDSFRIGAAAAVFILAGCATAPRHSATTIAEPFDETKAATLLKEGSSSLKGSALLRKQNGGIVTCAGFDVVLVPATEYARARMRVIYGNESGGLNPASEKRNPTFTPDPPAYSQLIRKTTCDAQGNFAFTGLSGGNFYVAAPVLWKTTAGDQGGIVSRLVTLKDAESKEIVISQ